MRRLTVSLSLFSILSLPMNPALLFAQRGCCSHHGGVCGDKCCDGTPLSAKCAGTYSSDKRSYTSGSSDSSNAYYYKQKALKFVALEHLKKGYQFYKQGNFEKALAYYNKAIELNPNSHSSYYYRGILFYKKKSLEKAKQDFQTSVYLYPKMGECYDYLGAILLSQRKYDDALTYLARAIQLNPKSAVAHYNTALCFSKKGDAKNALIHFNMSCELGFKPGCKALDVTRKTQ